MATKSVMLELHCPGLCADSAFAAWLNEWAGLGLAPWHCRSDEPGEMSDVFVMYDHGHGDNHPDGEGGTPRPAWDFVERQVKAGGLGYCLVRLINCEGRPTDFPTTPDLTDTPVVG